MTYYDELLASATSSQGGEYIGFTWLIDCDDGTELEYPEVEEDLARDTYKDMCELADKVDCVEKAITLYKRHHYEDGDDEEEYIESNC